MTPSPMISPVLGFFKSIVGKTNEDTNNTKETDDTITSSSGSRPSMSQSESLDVEILPTSPTNRFTHASRPSPSDEHSRASRAPPQPTRPLKRPSTAESEPHFKKRFRTVQVTSYERKLCRDNTNPPDAILAPNPQTYIHKSENMRSKPGSDQSLKPVDTLSKNGFQNTNRHSAATYGLKGQGSRRSAFSSMIIEDLPQTFPGQPRLKVERVASSPKRRKMSHIPNHSPEVISLDDDDDVVEVPRSAVALRGDSPGATISSRSHTSDENVIRQEFNGPHFSQRPFQDADNLLNPRSHRKQSNERAKPKQKSINPDLGNSLTQKHTSRSSSAQSDQHEFTPKYLQPNYLLEANHPVPEELSSEDELQADHGTVKSHHFQHMVKAVSGVNPSGSSRKDITRPSPSKSSTLIGNLHRKHRENLRDSFVRANPSDNIEDQDELSKEIPSLSKNNREDNAARSMAHASRKNRKGQPKVWPLMSVKTYGFKEYGPNLYLSWKEEFIYEFSRGEDRHPLEHVINLRKVNSAYTDDTQRIRLKGCADPSGTHYWYDLQFLQPQDILSFISEHLKPNTIKVHHYQDVTFMISMFLKPLLQNDKPGSTSLLTDQVLESIDTRHGPPSPGRLQRRGSKTRSRDGLVNRLTSIQAPSRQSAKPKISPSTGKSDFALHGRLARSTRSSTSQHPTLSDYNTPDDPPVVKYSVREGLGAPWSKPLQYGQGRRRALVEFEDLQKLDEDEMLNDALIDFYLIYSYNQAKDSDNSVYFFNTHFYTALTRPIAGQKGEINYSTVAKWVKEDIFAYDYIVVPVCENMHWYLAIICNVSGIGRKYTQEDVDSGSSMPQATEGAITELQATTDSTTNISGEETSKDQIDSDKPVGSDTSEVNLFDTEQGVAVEHPSIVEATPCGVDSRRETPEPGQNHGRESSLEETGQLKRLTIHSPTTDQKTVTEADEPGNDRIAAIAVESQETARAPADVWEAIPSTASTASLVEQIQSTSNLGKKKLKRKPNPLKRLSLTEPIILVLDSLGTTHPKACRVLKEYIAQEALNKRGMTAEITQKPFYVKENHIPLQNNFTDCGVYLLAYWEKFISNPREFVTRILSREMDPNTDWPDMTSNGIRKNVRDTLCGLAAEQNKAHREMKAAKKADRNLKNISQAEKEKEKSISEQPNLQTDIQSEPQPVQHQQRELTPNLQPELKVEHKADQAEHFEPRHEPQLKLTPDPQPRPAAKLLSPIQLMSTGPRSTTPVHSSPIEVNSKVTKSSESRIRKRSPRVLIQKTSSNTDQLPKDRSTSHRGSSRSPIHIDDSQDPVEARDMGLSDSSRKRPSPPAMEKNIMDNLVNKLDEEPSQSVVSRRRSGRINDWAREGKYEVEETPEPTDTHGKVVA